MIPLILLISSVLCSPIEYTGFSFTFKKDFVPEFYQEIYERAAKDSIDGKQFSNRNMSVMNGIGTLHLTKILGNPSNFNFTVNKEFTSTADTFTVKHYGASNIFSAEITFDYLITGWLFDYSGHGSYKFDAKSLEVVQHFYPDHSDANVRIEISGRTVTIDGNDFFGYLKNWILQLFTTKSDKSIETIFKEQSQIQAITTFNKFYKIHPFPALAKTANVLINNTYKQIYSREKDYFSFLYDTKIVMENDRPYRKELIRYYRDVDIKDGKFGVCMGIGVIPALAEVVGKLRDFRIFVDPKDVGLKNRADELYAAIPKLETILQPHEKYKIVCTVNADNNIIPVKNEMQLTVRIPANCILATENEGEEIISINVISKLGITYEVKDINGIVTIGWTLVKEGEITFEVKDSIGQVNDIVSLRELGRALYKVIVKDKILHEEVHLDVGYKVFNPRYTHNKDLICIVLVSSKE